MKEELQDFITKSNNVVELFKGLLEKSHKLNIILTKILDEIKKEDSYLVNMTYESVLSDEEKAFIDSEVLVAIGLELEDIK